MLEERSEKKNSMTDILIRKLKRMQQTEILIPSLLKRPKCSFSGKKLHKK
jgi:hypothetical protein